MHGLVDAYMGIGNGGTGQNCETLKFFVIGMEIKAPGLIPFRNGFVQSIEKEFQCLLAGSVSKL